MYGYYGFYWDPTYYLVVIGAIICLIASARVKGTFNRYNRVRSAIVPVANLGSTLSWPLIIIGLLFNSRMGQTLIMAGVIAFSLAVLFQLVTLPVEFNASARALRFLNDTGMLSHEELKGTKKVLKAAALTYVASAAAAILQLLRLLLLFGGNRRDD